MSKLQLEINEHVVRGGAPLHVASFEGLRGDSYGSMAKARANLREEITSAVRRFNADADNWRRTLIVCTDGAVLLVQWHGASWGHEIYRPGQRGSSACFGAKSFEDACADARRHAEQSFGGVAWESKP